MNTEHKITIGADFDPEISRLLAVGEINNAINNTAYAAQSADKLTLLILQSHLKKLCELQLSQLKGGENGHNSAG